MIILVKKTLNTHLCFLFYYGSVLNYGMITSQKTIYELKNNFKSKLKISPEKLNI